MSDGVTDKRGTATALLAFVCAVFFTLTIAFIHIITERLALPTDTLSQYALNKYGFILGLGFYSIGLTQLLIAFLLFSRIETNHFMAGSRFLLLAGIGVIIVALFPTLPPPASVFQRLPHIIGATMQFLFFPLAIFKIILHMAGSTFKIYTWLTGIITASLFVVILFLFLTPSMKDFEYFGLIEKINILTINFWLIIFSFILYKSKLNTKLFVES